MFFIFLRLEDFVPKDERYLDNDFEVNNSTFALTKGSRKRNIFLVARSLRT